ncbi:MAG: hypothetical protein ABI947_15590 [Chloroflexota bacterium]
MDFADFAKQIPIQILLAPIVLGIIYIIAISYVLQRARKRRQRKQAELAGTAVVVAPTSTKAPSANLSRLNIGNFLSGELPEQNMDPAPWTVPEELRGLPEPDLDMLAMPAMISVINALEPEAYQRHDHIENVVTIPGTDTEESSVIVDPNPPALEHDWLTVLSPEEANSEMAPTSTSKIPMPDGGLPGDAVEVMRVYRDLSDGKLIIQFGEGRYRTLAEISNPDMARRFSGLVRELWNMINNGLTPNMPPMPAPNTVVPPVDNTMGGKKTRMGLLNAEPEQPKTSIMQQFARSAIGQSAVPQTDSPAGIASAVEEFLQFRLSNTPEFLTRSIHIRASHDHGIIIEVDGHYYDSIGDVVDVNVRDFLLAMMREWEARH